MIDDRKRTRRLDREAAAWFTRLNGPIEAEELEAFDAWRSNPDHSAAYRRMEDISQAAMAMQDDPDLQQAAMEALARGPSRTDVRAHSRQVILRPSWRPWGGLVLAGAVACGIIGALALRAPDYQTKVGERFVAELADGSRVQLNTETKLRVRYSKGERRIELLQGQAFFDVAHDASRPFVVASGPVRVRALGTRFDVRRDAADTAVTLAQGSVRVWQESGAKAAWTLTPGEAVTVGKEAQSPKPTRVDVDSETGWTSGEVTFHSVPLAKAVAEMNRYERRKITLADGVPSTALITGTFKTGDETDFIAAVTATFDLEAKRRFDGAVELRPRSDA